MIVRLKDTPLPKESGTNVEVLGSSRSRRILISWLLVGAVLFSACGGVSVRRYEDIEYLRTESELANPVGDEQTAVDYQFDGSDMVVNVDSWHVCARQTTRIDHVTVVEQRTLKNDYRVHSSVAAAALIGAGLYGYIQRDSFAQNIVENEDSTQTFEEARSSTVALSATLIGAGVAALGYVVGATFKARDREHDQGERRSRSQVVDHVLCRERSGTELAVALELPDGTALSSTREDDRFRFEIGAYIEQFASGMDHTATLSVGDSTSSVALPLSAPYVGSALEFWSEQ